MATLRARITKEHVDRDLIALIEDLTSGRLEIPPHQREYCWKETQKEKFILSILKGYPIPSILMSAARRGDPKPTLEDGQQRITTACKFRRDEFTCGGRLFSQLTEIEQERFDKEKVIVITFYGASHDQRIEIFDWHQNGAPLTPGERYHAHQVTPLIKFVKETLMTPGMGLHDRASLIWGVRGDTPGVPSKDKGRKWLQSAVALIVGLAFGPKYMNKNYPQVVDKGFMTAESFTQDVQMGVLADLRKIIEIYEEVQRVRPVSSAKWLKYNWDMGNFTGYIVYSLSATQRERYEQGADTPEEKKLYDDEVYYPNSLTDDPDLWVILKESWVTYLSKVRRLSQENPKKTLASILKEDLHSGLSKARNWNLERWQDGYMQLFDPERVSVNNEAGLLGEDEEDDDDSESS
jgi:hypothetical protein